MPILFDQNATEGTILQVSTNRKFVRKNGAWVLQTNAAPSVEGAYPFLPPILSETTPALPNSNPFWQKTSTGKLYFQKKNGSTTTWAPVFEQVNETLIVASDTAPTFPCAVPFWQNTVDGSIYFQDASNFPTVWSAFFNLTPDRQIISQSTAPEFPCSAAFWHQDTTDILYFQQTVGDVSAWEIASKVDKYDLKVNTTTGAADLSSAQVFKVDNTTAGTKTVTVSNAPVGRAMTIVIKIKGAVGTIAYGNTVLWDGGSQPALGTAFTLITLFWDGTEFTGSAGQKA